MTITTADLTNDIKYFGSKIGEEFKLIGFVDVKHGDMLVFHGNLTQRSLGEVSLFLEKDITAVTSEDIQGLAQTEANAILATNEANKVIYDYITLYNLGLYGQ